MTTWNTTFNYNQPSFKMNFGEAMLYGAFGQLTGGIGGGCFGGYGMGGYGMGGSLFSMLGMGGYGCGMSSYMYDDSYAGAQVGFMGVNIALQGIGGYLQERKANKANLVTKDLLDSKASANLKVISDVSSTKIVSLADFDASKTAAQYDYSSLDAIVSKTNEEYATAQSNTAAAKAKLETLGGETGPKATDDKYKKTVTDSNGTESTTVDNEKFQADYIAWTNKKNEVTKLETIEATKKEAAKKAQNDRINKESAVQTAIDALKTLKEQYDEIDSAEKKQASEIKQKEEAKAAEKEAKAERKKDKEAFQKAWDDFKKAPDVTTKTAVDTALSKIDDDELRAKFQKTVSENPDYKKLKQ